MKLYTFYFLKKTVWNFDNIFMLGYLYKLFMRFLIGAADPVLFAFSVIIADEIHQRIQNGKTEYCYYFNVLPVFISWIYSYYLILLIMVVLVPSWNSQVTKQASLWTLGISYLSLSNFSLNSRAGVNRYMVHYHFPCILWKLGDWKSMFGFLKTCKIEIHLFK